MRLEKAWVVCNPTRDSTLADICFETSLPDGLMRQFRGGLTMDANPTVFTDRAEAEAEAHLRLVAMRAANAILDAAPEEPMRRAARIAVLDAEGKTLFASHLA